MAYIGNTVENQGFTPAIDYFNGNGVTVTFTLSRPIASVAQVIVAIDNVIQNPNSAFTVAGNAITFSSAPLSGTNNIWVEYTSLITTYQAISQDPTVIGDIRATGGYLAEGDFGNSFVDGAILDYVTGNGRLTVGDADGLTIYNGGTAGRTALLEVGATGNINIPGTGKRITGDFSNGTLSNRVAFQTSTANSTTSLTVLPNGTSTTSQLNLEGDPASANGAAAQFINVGGSDVRIASSIRGSGTYLPLTMYTGGSERLRIDTSGNVGIGTNNPGVYSSSAKVVSVNTSAGNNTVAMALVNAAGDTNTSVSLDFVPNTNITLAQIQAFRTNAFGGATDFRFLSYNGSSMSERMRIDSSGDVLIGTTTNYGSAKTHINSAGTVLSLYCSGGSGSPGIIIGKASNDASTSQVLMQFLYNSGSLGLGQINGNGSGSAAFGSYSDIRLKENITNVPSQLEKICALRPVEFDYKDGSGHQTGFIAQEIQEVYPEAVAVGQNEMLTVTGWNKTEAYLVKAIQEQQAIIEDLKARIETLEAK